MPCPHGERAVLRGGHAELRDAGEQLEKEPGDLSVDRGDGALALEPEMRPEHRGDDRDYHEEGRDDRQPGIDEEEKEEVPDREQA